LNKSWYNYFIYISLAFLTIVLYYADYLKIPRIYSYAHLTISLIILFSGFIISTISWKHILNELDYNVNFSTCVAGVGMSIFGKYIPGKFWMIMGQAAYIANQFDYSLGTLSLISLKTQFISLWLGLLFGMTGLLFLEGFHIWCWLISFILLVLTIIIFVNPAQIRAEKIVSSVLKKKIRLPTFTIRSTFSVMRWIFMYWMLWSFGFYLLAASLVSKNIPWGVGFGFPLAGTLGIMTFISPGGLGTREGVIVGYLTLAGIPFEEATSIALASRLWFLIGEIFIFLFGLLAHTKIAKAKRRS
jgi:uncharacterized membrane protein YbhN (UPF0104 family)